PKDLITDTLFIYDRLNCEYKSRLSYEQPDIKTWDFCLKINQLDAITLNFDLNELPENYHTTINIDGNSWNDLATGNYLYSFAPSQIGLLEGQIEITNNLWTSTENIIVKKISLTNYPNPFNPETVIRYSIGEEGKVELTIYNIKGQKVKTLVNETIPAGEYSIIWDGKDSNGKRVSSGIYFYKMCLHPDSSGKAGDFKKVRKMILLK
ncbi:MAG: T9SS type A sorting domain-containing protein, partial [Candidatus Cloacimonetes bacterium]|nr:T9SS type A sorting domain-containing protein [Candidatus Cloacimonadota bacterium]